MRSRKEFKEENFSVKIKIEIQVREWQVEYYRIEIKIEVEEKHEE